VLVEVDQSVPDAFARFTAATDSPREAARQSEALIGRLGGLGLELAREARPVPMFAGGEPRRVTALAAAGRGDLEATSLVVACEIDPLKLDALKARPQIKVWPNSTMAAFGRGRQGAGHCPNCAGRHPAAFDEARLHPFDRAVSAAARVDCRPFRPAATVDDLRELLAVGRVWDDGFRGQNVVVGVIDEGINSFYPVIGGHERPGGPRPGTADIGSHGSMCAADVLVAAPFAKLLDYPFLAGPDAGDSMVALEMFNAVLDQRRQNGTPHLTNNSYGFHGLPPRDEEPNHEAYDPEHPLNRKVREVIASGCPCFFAAGNCGSDCPSGNCHSSAIGPNRSISAANSLPECLTVAAVNSRHERIGYSAQGPGTLHPEKPDLSAYSHFFGNFGPGRPAGGTEFSFDNGTSAACPVAAGVGALLLSAFPGLTPARLRDALVQTAVNLNQPGWDADTGHGVVNAGAAYNTLRFVPPLPAAVPAPAPVEAGSTAAPRKARKPLPPVRRVPAASNGAKAAPRKAAKRRN
jgi:subtilisin family serine protease